MLNLLPKCTFCFHHTHFLYVIFRCILQAANAGLLSSQLENAQKDLGKLIESTIASVKGQINSASKKSQDLAVQIEGLAKGYEKKIFDDLEAKIRKVKQNSAFQA